VTRLGRARRTVVRQLTTRHATRGERGQSVVEFIIIVPVVSMLLLVMLEFGLAFNHRLTVGYASREGARIGAALANGGATNCSVADPALVDQQVIAATQRILKSPGSPIVMGDVQQIRIYKADSAGRQIGSLVNVWTHTPGTGPDIDPGPAVDPLDFTQATVAWPACGRVNGSNPDSIGVAVVYSYQLTTPLRAAAEFFWGSGMAASFDMTDQTVMALNPTN